MTTPVFRFVYYLAGASLLRALELGSKSIFSLTGILINFLLAATLWLAAEFLMGRAFPFLAGLRLCFGAPFGASLSKRLFLQQLYFLAIDTVLCLGFVQAASELKLIAATSSLSMLFHAALLLAALFVDGTVGRSIKSTTILHYAEDQSNSSGDSCRRCV
jgi:hypothetical protein